MWNSHVVNEVRCHLKSVSRIIKISLHFLAKHLGMLCTDNFSVKSLHFQSLSKCHETRKGTIVDMIGFLLSNFYISVGFQAIS